MENKQATGKGAQDLSTVRKVLSLFTEKERRWGYLLLAMIMGMALLDMAGVASILPFVVVLTDSEAVENNRWLAWAYEWLGFTDTNSFLIFLGVLLFTVKITVILFKALTEYALMRFTHMRNYTLSCRLFKGYLGRPYSWFLDQHSADLGKSILSEVNMVTNKVIIPGLKIIANCMVAVLLVALLVWVDPLLASLVALALVGVYGIIYYIVRNYLSRIGSDRVTANRERYQVAQEAFGGIKEVKIFGREKSFFNRFTGPAYRFVRHQVNSKIIGEMPQYIIQMMATCGILFVILYFYHTRGNLQLVLPVLTVYAFAGARLMPAVQSVYTDLTTLRFGLPALDRMYADLIEFVSNSESPESDQPESLVLEDRIILENICFSYPNASVPALKNVNLTIPRNSTMGLVGATGSGKTTVVDLILGLLEPNQGRLLVDETPVSADVVQAWQRNLGYVPQYIYLADSSIASNIAFGIPSEEIDMEAVVRAGKIADLHEFIEQELSDGYETKVGERGVRLSGGQRQRIGIARALYHDPGVLIFDEATSALDNLTEQAVMDAIHNLGHSKTIILIAHRLTTVKECDNIVMIDKGEIAAQGSYEKLIEENSQFRSMARGG